MDYLKDPQYYIERYDLYTIKRCLEHIERVKKVFSDSYKEKKLKDIPEEEREKAYRQILGWDLFVTKTEEYRRKEEIIEEWMARDKVEQDMYDNTPEPKEVHCLECGEQMESSLKSLHNFTDEPMRMLFFFECKDCNKRRGIYNDGEEFSTKPTYCTKCNEVADIKHDRNGEIITWTTTCSKCGHVEVETDNFEESRIKREKEEKVNKELLEKYREEFCLSEKEGKENVETLDAMKFASEVFEFEKRKYDDPVFEAVSKIKKLGISEVEKIINETIEQNDYSKINFGTPEFSKFVIVPFTVQDNKSDRSGNHSTMDLGKLLKKTLEGTNWKLISGELSFRLGYLSGRLKGYESEEDFHEFVGKQKRTEEIKLDPEKEIKFLGNNIVQLARISGKYEGIENMRKRRLKKEPEGFFLEDREEGGYKCKICDNHIPGSKTWWNQYGLKCLDCRRNIVEGIIPKIVDTDEKSWIKEWQIDSNYGVKAMTRKKLIREGLLHKRDLKRNDGNTYCTIYLVSENQEFINKYPKKSDINRYTFVDASNNEVVM